MSTSTANNGLIPVNIRDKSQKILKFFEISKGVISIVQAWLSAVLLHDFLKNYLKFFLKTIWTSEICPLFSENSICPIFLYIVIYFQNFVALRCIRSTLDPYGKKRKYQIAV